ncbi:MAG: CoA pyrophosphatase, partial [Pseudomonadota bacterium]
MLADDHPLTALVRRPLVPAAVLVPLVYRDGWHIILTQRTDKLSNHAGQISFPGGRREEADVSYIDTALRESQEEIGLERDRVSLLGFL